MEGFWGETLWYYDPLSRSCILKLHSPVFVSVSQVSSWRLFKTNYERTLPGTSLLSFVVNHVLTSSMCPETRESQVVLTLSSYDPVPYRPICLPDIRIFPKVLGQRERNILHSSSCQKLLLLTWVCGSSDSNLWLVTHLTIFIVNGSWTSEPPRVWRPTSQSRVEDNDSRHSRRYGYPSTSVRTTLSTSVRRMIE